MRSFALLLTILMPAICTAQISSAMFCSVEVPKPNTMIAPKALDVPQQVVTAEMFSTLPDMPVESRVDFSKYVSQNFGAAPDQPQSFPPNFPVPNPSPHPSPKGAPQQVPTQAPNNSIPVQNNLGAVQCASCGSGVYTYSNCGQTQGWYGGGGVFGGRGIPIIRRFRGNGIPIIRRLRGRSGFRGGC